MASVFHRLISKEFGKNKYNKYFFCYQKLIEAKKFSNKTINNAEIYEDIYEQLKDKDINVLNGMLERLLEAMYDALRISKYYILVFIFYILSGGFLILLGLVPWITVCALAAISICFLYKTYEFVVNKYCYIDAHIILVYKSVLDKLIMSYDNEVDQTKW